MNQQLLYAYHGFFIKVFQTPFYVAADHERRKIIISVRGTRSFTVINTPVAIMEYVSTNYPKDALTDL